MKSANRIKAVMVSVFLVLVAFLWGGPTPIIPVSGAATHPSQNANRSHAKLQPILFIENRGQTADAVKYYAGAGIQRVYMTRAGMVFDLVRRKPQCTPANGGKPASLERLVFTMGFEGTACAPTIKALVRRETTVNYFLGADPTRWRTRIPTFNGILYENIYPGIDLKVYGKGDVLEYEFIVAPGADTTLVRLFYDGIDGLRVSGEGRLVLETPFGELEEARPHIYQMIHGKKTVVEGEFKIYAPSAEILSSESQKSAKRSKIYYGFAVGPHDSSHPLIIDPTLIYSTFLGGAT